MIKNFFKVNKSLTIEVVSKFQVFFLLYCFQLMNNCGRKNREEQKPQVAVCVLFWSKSVL